MSDALSAPWLTAAALLVVSGLAKLRRPGPARTALAAAGLAVGRGTVRAFSALELGLGGLAVLHPGRLAAAALALAYAGFGALTLVLARRRAACGCFGSGSQTPASPVQALLSAGLATVCLLAAAWPAHGLGWVLDRPGGTAAALVIGLGGCVYGAIVAYTQLPAAWGAWAGR